MGATPSAATEPALARAPASFGTRAEVMAPWRVRSPSASTQQGRSRRFYMVSQGADSGMSSPEGTADRVRMRATFKPNGTRYYDGVQTGTANCGTGQDFACIF